jgi:hypothetical protein
MFYSQAVIIIIIILLVLLLTKNVLIAFIIGLTGFITYNLSYVTAKKGGVTTDELVEAREKLRKIGAITPERQISWPMSSHEINKLTEQQEEFVKDKSKVNEVIQYIDNTPGYFALLVSKYKSPSDNRTFGYKFLGSYFEKDYDLRDLPEPNPSRSQIEEQTKNRMFDGIDDDTKKYYLDDEKDRLILHDKYAEVLKKYNTHREKIREIEKDTKEIKDKIFELEGKIWTTIKSDKPDIYTNIELKKSTDVLYDKLFDIENKSHEYKMEHILPLIKELEEIGTTNSEEAIAIIKNIRQNERILLDNYSYTDIWIAGVGVQKSLKNVPDAHHAESLLIDKNSKEILLIDPHVKPNGEFKLDVIKFINNLKFNSEIFREYKFFTLSDYHYYSDIKCGIFQGSFIENKGLCVLWNVYMQLLFAINPRNKFKQIIKIHDKNPRFTKYKLEVFAYEFYEMFKNNIISFNKSLDSYKRDESFHGPISKSAKPEDCTEEFKYYSDILGKCYSTEDEKTKNEIAYKKNRCESYGQTYNETTGLCQ